MEEFEAALSAGLIGFASDTGAQVDQKQQAEAEDSDGDDGRTYGLPPGLPPVRAEDFQRINSVYEGKRKILGREREINLSVEQ